MTQISLYIDLDIDRCVIVPLPSEDLSAWTSGPRPCWTCCVSLHSALTLNLDRRYLNLLQESAVVSAPPLSAPLSPSDPGRVLTDEDYCLLHTQLSVAAWVPRSSVWLVEVTARCLNLSDRVFVLLIRRIITVFKALTLVLRLFDVCRDQPAVFTSCSSSRLVSASASFCWALILKRWVWSSFIGGIPHRRLLSFLHLQFPGLVTNAFSHVISLWMLLLFNHKCWNNVK